HSALAPSGQPIWLDMAARSARALLRLEREGITTRKVLTDEAVHNAMTVHAAFGGSTNLLLHIPAVAHSAGLRRPAVADWIGVNPDDVIMDPTRARERGLTSTVTFPRGNLAPQGSVIKSTSIDPSVVDADGVYRKTGPARVFTTERAVIAAIKEHRIKSGDVI